MAARGVQYNRVGHRFHAKRRGETGIYSDPGLRNLPLNNVRQSTPCNDLCANT